MNAAFRKWKTCERKKAFPTREAAFQKGQEIYRCPYCRQFHRTAETAKLIAAIRRSPKLP